MMATQSMALPEGAAEPKGPFTIRICAGCGEQVNDGHHGHGWKGKGLLTPVYEVPAVLQSEALTWDECHTLRQGAQRLHRWNARRYLKTEQGQCEVARLGDAIVAAVNRLNERQRRLMTGRSK